MDRRTGSWEGWIGGPGPGRAGQEDKVLGHLYRTGPYEGCKGGKYPERAVQDRSLGGLDRRTVSLDGWTEPYGGMEIDCKF